MNTEPIRTIVFEGHKGLLTYDVDSDGFITYFNMYFDEINGDVSARELFRQCKAFNRYTGKGRRARLTLEVIDE